MYVNGSSWVSRTCWGRATRHHVELDCDTDLHTMLLPKRVHLFRAALTSAFAVNPFRIVSTAAVLGAEANPSAGSMLRPLLVPAGWPIFETAAACSVSHIPRQ